LRGRASHDVVVRSFDYRQAADRRTADAWKDAQPRFTTHVLGPHLEQLARDFSARYAAPATVGGPVTRVGPAVINDAKQRAPNTRSTLSPSAGPKTAPVPSSP
jgi:hypothetical protein